MELFTTGEWLAIAIAILPNVITFIANRKLIFSQAENYAAQTIGEYTKQVDAMRKEMSAMHEQERKWKSLYDEAMQKLEWATEYIEILTHQIQGLGQNPVAPNLPPKVMFKMEKKQDDF